MTLLQCVDDRIQNGIECLDPGDVRPLERGGHTGGNIALTECLRQDSHLPFATDGVIHHLSLAKERGSWQTVPVARARNERGWTGSSAGAPWRSEPDQLTCGPRRSPAPPGSGSAHGR